MQKADGSRGRQGRAGRMAARKKADAPTQGTSARRLCEAAGTEPSRLPDGMADDGLPLVRRDLSGVGEADLMAQPVCARDGAIIATVAGSESKGPRMHALHAQPLPDGHDPRRAGGNPAHSASPSPPPGPRKSGRTSKGDGKAEVIRHFILPNPKTASLPRLAVSCSA